MELSKRAQQLTPSATLAITAKVKEMQEKGLDVIGLGAGEPDFNTPQHILDAAAEAAQAGHTKYTASGGILELRKTIAEKLQKDNGLTYDPQQICVTSGAKQALYNLFQAVINPGDEVIIPAPYWVSYVEQVKLAGGVPVIVRTAEEQMFKLTPERLADAITERTKLLLINSPSNPTGMIYTRDELSALGRVCVERGIGIVSDEIYEKLIYEGEHVSIASLSEELYANTFVINGVSKTYAMTGWRIGYVAGDPAVIKAMTGISSHSTSNPTTLSQYAAYAALSGTQEPIKKMKRAFAERKNYLVERMKDLPRIHPIVPQGAFYVFANITEAIEASNGRFRNASDWSAALLEEEHVALVPGAAFGAPNHIRLSYATSMEQLVQAMDRIERFLNLNVTPA